MKVRASPTDTRATDMHATDMHATDIRVNARLRGHDAQCFQDLLAHSGQSASAVLRAALQAYHARLRPTHRDPVQLLAGFVAGGAGPEDLSAQYKAYRDASLVDKLADAP